jgi:hypothetical protein
VPEENSCFHTDNRDVEMLIRFKRAIREAGRQLDRAIALGVSAMYPIVFTLPAPDPLPDWKRVARLGWKVAKVTVAETIRVIRKNGFPRLESGQNDTKKGLNVMTTGTFWDLKTRMAMVSKLLVVIQGDLSEGCYAQPGRPTLFTAMSVIHAEPEALNTLPELLPFSSDLRSTPRSR